jgi:hypothetical protein
MSLQMYLQYSQLQPGIIAPAKDLPAPVTEKAVHNDGRDDDQAADY